MKRTIQVYIEGQRLELFNDEKIQVNSTLKSVNDISKTFTDFSQSFSVPASVKNNQIFQHFYNSDLLLKDGVQIDPNLRRPGSIEINLTPFRTGKIQLEKANIKKGMIDSYSITFYGDGTSLKDKFGELKLSDLTLNSYSHSYTGTEVQNRITDQATDYDIRYPLISSSRKWSYGDGTANDISTSGGKIAYTELYPAIKVSKIFEAIETDLGITFNGNFLTEDYFTKLFLWCKNSDQSVFEGISTIIDLSSVAYSPAFASWPTPEFLSVDLTNNTIRYNYTTAFIANHSIQVTITPSDLTAAYYIDVYKNGTLGNSISTVGGGALTGVQTFFVVQNQNNIPGLDETILLKARSVSNITITANIKYYAFEFFGQTLPPYIADISVNSMSLLANVNLNSLLPEMKIQDFFRGVLQMFNLTCYGTDTDVFQIETVDKWYEKGTIHDITQYTDVNAIDVKRLPLFETIAFKYQESESITNKQFQTLFFRGYGDSESSFNYDGGEFKIELPFENIMGEKYTNTNIQVAYSLNEDLNAYTPKPCLFYMMDKQTSSSDWYFNDGSSTAQLTSYIPFGQDLQMNGTDNYSLNFDIDNSTFLLQPIQNGLYRTYYSGYLLNLYDLQNRLETYKTNLPISLLTTLKLNDRLIIRSKRYIINEMKSDLTSGEVNFQLIHDFRDVLPNEIINTKPDSNCVNVPIQLPNDCIQAVVSTSASGVTITPSTFTADGNSVVCVPANANTKKRLVTEDTNTLFPEILHKNINTEDFFRVITEGSANQIITLTVTYSFNNMLDTTQTITIVQP